MWPPARARARRQSGVRLGERLSRTDVDHAKRFPELAAAAARLRVPTDRP
jgi:hypothetical protein